MSGGARGAGRARRMAEPKAAGAGCSDVMGMARLPLLSPGGALALIVGVGVICAGCRPAGDRPPQVTSNPEWRAPDVVTETPARVVVNRAPREWLRVERATAAPKGARLLFWDYQPAARDPRGRYYVSDRENHRILVLDERLRLVAARRPTGGDGERLTRPDVVAAWRNDTLAAFESSGALVLFDLWGRTFERRAAPFPAPVGAWTPDGRLVLARSPVLFPFTAVEQGAPLLVLLSPDPAGEVTPVDTARQPPPEYWYSGIALNSGMVAADPTGAFYFAWLVQPEIRKYDASGTLLWTSRRAIPFSVEIPRLVPMGEGERPRLLLHTVHKSIAVGPDGLLYARAAADSTNTRDRLEVFDPATGEWLRSAPLDTGSVVLVGRRGRVWEVLPQALRLDVAPERHPLPSYALPTLRGDTLRLEDARGRALVVTFWASWCQPCKEELPLLDTLYRNTPRSEFEVHAISEDVNVEDARTFAEALDLSFPVLLGRGKMRQRYHYQGLPYAVLADRQGRLAREFYGFGGRDDYVSKVVPLIRQEIEEAAARP